MATGAKPRTIIILSGKRKSGKDYIAELLIQRLGSEKTVILRLSGPLKHQYAKEHNLDYEKLLDSSNYKEIYREDMIGWGEAKRNADPGYFCQLAIDLNKAWDKSIWIISDARRPSDIQYFKDNFGEIVKTVRVQASNETRSIRGWSFTKGVDDVESECGLDNYSDWDYSICNEGNPEELESFICEIKKL